jgi:transcriptional regulator with XRE-family HTH domain
VFDPDPVVDKLRLEVPRFAQALKDARTAAGWSQLELAIRLGLKQASISHYERGRMQPGMATLYAIQRLFGWGDFYGTPTTEEATVPEPAVAIERVEPAPLVVVEAVPDDRGDIIGRAMAELTRMHAACMAALTDINGENLRLRETILNLRRENRNLARQRTA